MRRRSAAQAFLALALALATGALACNQRGRQLDQPVRGVITAVEAQSVSNADRIIVRDAQGKTWDFRVAPDVDVTPGHLRQHMAFGEPVTVYYRRTPDGLVAYQITD
jgi:hypothetical protein